MRSLPIILNALPARSLETVQPNMYSSFPSVEAVIGKLAQPLITTACSGRSSPTWPTEPRTCGQTSAASSSTPSPQRSAAHSRAELSERSRSKGARPGPTPGIPLGRKPLLPSQTP